MEQVKVMNTATLAVIAETFKMDVKEVQRIAELHGESINFDKTIAQLKEMTEG